MLRPQEAAMSEPISVPSTQHVCCKHLWSMDFLRIFERISANISTRHKMALSKGGKTEN